MQKDLASAMKDELPQIHHRMCARHVYAAWAKNGLRGKKSMQKNSWICDVAPRAIAMIERNKLSSFNWIVTFNGDDGYLQCV